MKEPLPCPFCGHVGVVPHDDSSSKWGAASCAECGACGPEVRTGYQEPDSWMPGAIEEWNRRSV
jgi:transcription elongation factor Elf1